ncbi:MAG: NAD(P)H-hydrate dehydratase [Ruminococcus sp.]|nr:NAD(P)H-hydrate dehydratase [Ruminococcus sp.]
MKRYLTVAQMVECEQRSDREGLSLAELMDNAAGGLYRAVTKAAHELSIKKSCSANKVCIIAGKGNNGGDGLVCAGLLDESGFDVSVIMAQGEPATELSKAAYQKLGGGVRVISGSDENAAAEIFGADIVVDCIFGTGFKGALREDARLLFSAIEQSPAYKIACDIPSGCNADTGLCDELSVRADMTVTFHKAKVGMALEPTKSRCGEIAVYDIGIKEEYKNLPFLTFEPDERQLRQLLPSRSPGAHKGDFGRLLIIAGSENYYGAAAMAANAALRCGVGIVQLAAPKSVISALAGSMYECTFLPYEQGDEPQVLDDAIKSASAVLIGCGMGVSDHTHATLKYTIENAGCPLIIDADGLNCLALNRDILLDREGETILTPHIGELARLCGVDTNTAIQERLPLALGINEKYGAVVVSKSAGTLIVSKGSVILSGYGNTALSKGGSGDMLAGMVSAFTAQRVDGKEAAALGCYLLGRSAEILSEEMSQRGILARDILLQIPKTLSELERKAESERR